MSPEKPLNPAVNTMPDFQPEFGWAYTTPARRANSVVHFFWSNKKYAPSLCKRFGYREQGLAMYPDVPKCSGCIKAGTKSGTFI